MLRYIQTKRSGFKPLLRDSDRTQTCNLLIRSQMLYSIKLRSRIASANILTFFFSASVFVKFFIFPPFWVCLPRPMRGEWLAPTNGVRTRGGRTPGRCRRQSHAGRSAPAPPRCPSNPSQPLCHCVPRRSWHPGPYCRPA